MKNIILLFSLILSAGLLFAHDSPLNENEYNDAISQMKETRVNKEFTISFVSNGGLLKENEHAIVPYIDAGLLPPALMLSYQYGLFYWITIGLDVGGNYGVFQALLTVKQEMFRTRESDFIFIGWHIKTGFKQHEVKLSDALDFTDLSYIILFENTIAMRLGKNHKQQKQVLYLSTQFYFDFDLHEERRQTDIYIAPAVIGFETFIGKYGSFFIEAGAMMSINGMETDTEILYEKQWFPIGKLGFALRTGNLTADIYNNPKNLKKYDEK